jgi:hypothetical protein
MVLGAVHFFQSLVGMMELLFILGCFGRQTLSSLAFFAPFLWNSEYPNAGLPIGLLVR